MSTRSGASRSVAGRVALITGAASGMGRAIAHLFADEGASVALIDRTAGGIELVVGELRAAGASAAGQVADVADRHQVEAAVSELRAELGPIDILINNAGISLPAPIGAGDYAATWATTLAVNLESHTHLVRACLDDLLRRGDGRIVNIASTEAMGATPGISPYTASKHGVVGLTRALAVELGRQGVTVNCVSPGPVRTAMTAAIPEQAKDAFARRRVPLGRYGEPDEIAYAVLSLAVPAASYINGAVLVVDGGLTAQNT